MRVVENPKRKIPEYLAWKSMKSRCYSPSANKGSYKTNGITVCKEWLNDYERFFFDMGKKPTPKHSLDRIDNSGPYSKSNCQWVTHDVQVKNRGDFNKVFTFNGETKILKDWAKHFGLKYTTIHQRIFRSGLSFEDAIHPVKPLTHPA